MFARAGPQLPPTPVAPWPVAHLAERLMGLNIQMQTFLPWVSLGEMYSVVLALFHQNKQQHGDTPKQYP